MLSDQIAAARTLAGLTRRQLALLADVSPSTVSRIESGQVDPSTGVWERLMRAAGYQPNDTLVRISGNTAVMAARSVLDTGVDLIGDPDIDGWLKRWERAGFLRLVDDAIYVPNPARLAQVAGLQNRLALRPGIVNYGCDRSWLDVANQLGECSIDWAMTGGVAANRLILSADAPWSVFYVDDPIGVAQQLGLSDRPEPGWPISFIPFDMVSKMGVDVDGSGLRWASPIQVWLDCFSGSDRMPQQADALSELFGYDRADA